MKCRLFCFRLVLAEFFKLTVCGFLEFEVADFLSSVVVDFLLELHSCLATIGAVHLSVIPSAISILSRLLLNSTAAVHNGGIVLTVVSAVRHVAAGYGHSGAVIDDAVCSGLITAGYRLNNLDKLFKISARIANWNVGERHLDTRHKNLEI